jgi:hypothetical protein
MVSRIFFSFLIGSTRYDALHVDIKQTAGSKFEEHPFEVGHPFGYDGPISYGPFRNAVESYYRRLVGNQGQAFNISPDAYNITMQDSFIHFPMETEIEVDPERGGGWPS